MRKLIITFARIRNEVWRYLLKSPENGYLYRKWGGHRISLMPAALMALASASPKEHEAMDHNEIRIKWFAANLFRVVVLFGFLVPLGVALSFTSVRAEPFAYVTNISGNNVSVIDTATNTLAATVPVGSFPIDAAVHPEGTFVYVVNTVGNSVSVIDTATNTVTATVPVGTDPFGVAVHPAGTFVYVTNINNDYVSVIDTATNTVTTNIQVGSNYRGITVHPAGTFVYVTNQFPSFVSVIDTSSNTVVATIPWEQDSISLAPGSLAVHPAGTFVYVANQNNNSVSILETSTNTITATIPIGATPVRITVDPAGSFVYVTKNNNTVSVIDTATNTVTATVPVGVGAGPVGVAVHPTDALVYTANQNNNTVSVIDTSTNTVAVTIPAGAGPTGIAIMPDTNNTFTFTGFFTPIDNNGVLNQAKAGQIIPLKWHLTDSAGDPVSDPTSFVKVTSVLSNCAGATAGIDVIEEYAAGESGLQYIGDGYWQFNWKTPKSYAQQCRILRLHLADQPGVPESRTAWFQFK
jgi:YVTN family beta-propeller protein